MSETIINKIPSGGVQEQIDDLKNTVGSVSTASGTYTTASWATGTNTCTWAAPADGTYIIWENFSYISGKVLKYVAFRFNTASGANQILNTKDLMFQNTTVEGISLGTTISAPFICSAGATITPYIHTDIAGTVFNVKIAAMRIK